MHARPTARRAAARSALALTAAVATLAATAACGRNDSPAAGASTAANGVIDASRCTGTTTGVTADSITFGLSHPESGPSAVTGQISKGVQAWFDYVNAEQGGVKGHRLKLVTKDDGAAPARTVANVNEMLEKDKVFGFVQNLGTPNNLAVRDRLDKQCVPNLLVANGSPALVDPVGHPFTLIANAPYAAEVAAFVDYVEKNQPGARIASISENSDFGKSYRTPLEKVVQGRSVTLATQQTYEPSDPDVASQFTAIKASKANALFVGAAAVKCPQSLDAKAGLGIRTTYVSANCTSKAILGLAKPENVDGVLSENANMDPNDPGTASDPRMKLYFDKVKQYAPGVDPRNSLIAYGWTQGAILTRILAASPSLDRVAVMNTARNLTISDGPGVLDRGIVWKTAGTADPYPIESFRLTRWDSSVGRFRPLPDLSSYEGRSGQLR